MQDSDPGEEFPYEMRAMISGRKRHDYRMGFLPCLAFLEIEHSNRFISLIRFAVAVDGDTIPNLPLDACEKTGKAWFQRHIEALEKYLWIPEETYIRWAIAHREKAILMRMAAQAPDAICEVIGKVPAEDYGYLLNQMKRGNPALYEKVGRELEADYRRIAAEQDVKGLEPAGDRARDYLLGIIELEDILPYAQQWKEQRLQRYYGSGQLDWAARIHNYPEYGEMQLYRRALVLECLRQEDTYFKKYWVEEGLPELENSWQNSHKNGDRRQIEGMLRLLEGEVGDGGVYRTFVRQDQDNGVELAFSGSYAGGENETVVVYDACFYGPGEEEKTGWQYKPVRRKLAEVDPRYFSEVVLQLSRATASSDMRLKYPECREW